PKTSNLLLPIEVGTMSAARGAGGRPGRERDVDRREGAAVMRKLIPCLGVLGLALVLPTAAGADRKEAVPKLYVTNSAGDNIHIIDLGSFKVVGEIRTGEHPHGAAVSADGRRFFTTVEGDHTLPVIDTSG